jgi:hypothetical protein
MVELMSLQKDLPIRNKKYLKWVKTLPSCISGRPSDDPHHIIGVGRGKMGGTDCDLFAMPVTRDEHQLIHKAPSEYEQWKYVAMTLRQAVKEGVLVFNPDALK